jgi:hypothetical protein
MPLGIAEFPSSSHALLLPVFLPAENSEVGSTTIYETSSSLRIAGYPGATRVAKSINSSTAPASRRSA